MEAGFDGVLLIASNPVDIMSLLALRQSQLPAERVIGTGTLLDSSRLKQALAEQLNVAPAAIDAMVLGEHGDSEVPAFSTVRVGGLTLDQFARDQMPDLDQLASHVRTSAYEIIKGKGYTSFGIATAIVRICEAILRDERSVLPVSVLLTGELGVSGVFRSLPCVLGARGIERILLPNLSDQEIIGLKASAATLQEALKALT
jgi:L-lactate dehydrogenase